MRILGIALALICTGLALTPGAAQAQATRTWVSGVGDDANPCSRTAPCRTFPGAIPKTAAGGEIDTLDPGSFSTVTITKAITIASEGSGEAGILAAGTNGVTVNCATDPNCVVILRGLEIDGGPTGSNSLAGVRFVAGKALIVQHCAIRNFTGGAPNGYGINFSPTGAGNLFVDDTTIVTNGQPGSTGGGIFIDPTGTPNVNVTIRNTQASNNNGFGIRVDTTGATGGIVGVSVSDSETSGNANAGIAAVSGLGGTAVVVNVDHSTITHNVVGINGTGATVTFRTGTSTIMNNATGVKQGTSSTMTSYGTNQISDNPIPGFTLPVVGPS